MAWSGALSGALAETIAALEAEERLAAEDAALVAHCRVIAAMLDDGQGDDKLLHEYRMSLKDLREATANVPSNDEFAILLDALRTDVGDTPVAGPVDGGRPDRKGRRPARPAVDALAAVDRGRGRRARS